MKVFTTIHFQVFTNVEDRLNPDSKRFADVRGLWKTDFKPDNKRFCEPYTYSICYPIQGKIVSLCV